MGFLWDFRGTGIARFVEFGKVEVEVLCIGIGFGV